MTITFSEAAAGKTLADVKKDLTGVVEADKADVTLNGFTWNDGDKTKIVDGQEYDWTEKMNGKKAENGKVVHIRSSREERPPAESGSGQGVDEVHPGADPVSA